MKKIIYGFIVLCTMAGIVNGMRLGPATAAEPEPEDLAFKALRNIDGYFKLIELEQASTNPNREQLSSFAHELFENLQAFDANIQALFPRHAMLIESRLFLAVHLLIERTNQSTDAALQALATPAGELGLFFVQIGAARNHKNQLLHALAQVSQNPEKIASTNRQTLAGVLDIALTSDDSYELAGLATAANRSAFLYKIKRELAELNERSDTDLVGIIGEYTRPAVAAAAPVPEMHGPEAHEGRMTRLIRSMDRFIERLTPSARTEREADQLTQGPATTRWLARADRFLSWLQPAQSAAASAAGAPVDALEEDQTWPNIKRAAQGASAVAIPAVAKFIKCPTEEMSLMSAFQRALLPIASSKPVRRICGNGAALAELGLAYSAALHGGRHLVAQGMGIGEDVVDARFRAGVDYGAKTLQRACGAVATLADHARDARHDTHDFFTFLHQLGDLDRTIMASFELPDAHG